MIWIILGLVLWTAAHTFKRWAPATRESLGGPGAGLVALGAVGAIVLMVIGYRSVETVPLWHLGLGATIANNLLMLVAIALLGVGNSRSRLRGTLRHPMLTGVIVWAIAHLLVSGDLESLVLFGGLAIWAMLEMAVINRSDPAPAQYTEGTVQGDIRLAIITVVVMAVIMGIHVVFGLRPWP